MTDAKTLAYINLYGILGCLENLCELDEEASELADPKKPVSIAFTVKGGPAATLTFANGRCRMEQGADPKADVLIPFGSCEKFNGLIDGTVTPLPIKGFTKIGFLLNNFTKMTDILTAYLRPEPEKLEDPVFFEKSTKIMMYLIAVAISQIANNDDIGKFSASNIPDGIIEMGIKDELAVTIRVKNHHLVTIKQKPAGYHAKMEFQSIKLARDLFDGKVNAVACIGEGTITMGGLVNMIDNLNRILDRVGIYLA